MRPPDAVFADPRLAVFYDALDGDRSDLDAYEGIVKEVSARSVVDIGCGTGCLAVRLAALGLDVIGVDPAGASLAVARDKPFAERVTWVAGDAAALAGLEPEADLALMTGNVAQVFVADLDWRRTLDAIRHALRPGGWLAFETRRAEVRDWENWDVPPTRMEIPGHGDVVFSRSVTEVAMPLVTFETVTVVGGQTVPSTSTLRFRSPTEVEQHLVEHGFAVIDVRDAPDRPGKEHVFLARRDGARAQGGSVP